MFAEHEQRRGLGLTLVVESLPEAVVERLPHTYTWARRRAMEPPSRGWLRRPTHNFDLWFDSPPGEPPRKPDACEPSAAAAVNRIARHHRWR